MVDYDTQVGRYELVVHHGGTGILYHCLRHAKPAVVYPNRSVRVVLPLDEGDLLCKARIVWARVETPSEARAGIPSNHEIASDCAILRMVVRHTTPAVRPDDILTALRETADLAPPRPPLVTRLAQGPLDTATARVTDPLT